MKHVVIAALAALVAFPAFAQTSSDWYPTSIALPAGHKYPCNLTALPRDLTGIPPAEKTYINHVYAMLLKCVQAKVLMTDALMEDNQSWSAAYAKYYADTNAALQKILKEPAPKGLEPFRQGVSGSIIVQAQFFDKAAKARQQGQSAQQVLNIPEGRKSSQLLQSTWGEMQSRYPSMSSAVKDSTYHHLCALDLF